MNPLNGLILCGGKSSRLGYPKHTLIKEGKMLYQWWMELLKPVCEETYISCNTSQVNDFWNANLIIDEQEDTGPLNGIKKAFDAIPDSDWLVIACDLVYVETNHIQKLISTRNESVESIAFYNAENNSPFPLCSIYKSAIKIKLDQEYSSELKSARRLLENSDTFLIYGEDPEILKGINTLMDLETWKSVNESN